MYPKFRTFCERIREPFTTQWLEYHGIALEVGLVNYIHHDIMQLFKGFFRNLTLVLSGGEISARQ